MRSAIHYIFFLAFSFFPMYLFGSGGIQITHALLLIGVTGYSISNKFKLPRPNLYLLMFCLLVLFREAIAVIFDENPVTLLSAAYYIFNLIIFWIVGDWLSTAKKSYVYLKFGMISAIAMALLGIMILGFRFSADAEGGRAIGTFNNPNQLGYFSVCAFSIVAVLFFQKLLNRIEFITLTATCCFLSIASLSKAAMLSIFIPSMAIGWLLIPNIKYKTFIGLSVFFIFALTFLYIFFFTSAFEGYAFYNRLAAIGSDNDDSLEARGYNIILNANAGEFLWGLGSEHARKLIGHEVHSTFASIMANYGVIGLLLFLTFIGYWIRGIYHKFKIIGLLMIAFPPMFYGITHNGTRFSIFWILLALSFSLFNEKSKQKLY